MNLSKYSTEELETLKTKLENGISKTDIYQLSMKILLNSLYGALGNNHFPLFDIRQAEGITTTGQLAIKTAMKALDELSEEHDVNNILIYGDTDSVYFSLKEILDRANIKEEEKVDFCDDFCSKTVAKKIEKSYESLANTLNCPQNTMDMEREVIAPSAIWSAKKRYAMKVLDSEGFRFPTNDPYIKIMGLDIIKSNTPAFFKGHLKTATRMMLDGVDESNIKSFSDKIFSEMKKQKPEDIATNMGVSFIEKYLDSNGEAITGTPWNTKAAIAHNNYIKRENLKEIKPIQQGDKIKLIPLVSNNPAKNDVFAFDSVFPSKLLKYVDYTRTFEKGFKSPLASLTDAVKWSMTETNSADGLF